MILGAQNFPLWGLSVTPAGRGIICVGLNGAQNTPYIWYPEFAMSGHPPRARKVTTLGTPWAFTEGTDGAGPLLLMLGAQKFTLWGLSVTPAGRGIICVGLNGAQNTPYILYPELAMSGHPPRASKVTPLCTPSAFILGTGGAGPFLLMLGAQNFPLWGLSAPRQAGG